ncbi:MAG: sulfotransferase [Pseudomonadota bacterium]
MTEIVYILGAGRSGSTLLDRLLGSARGAISLGEVHSLWRLPLADLTCSCGASGHECGFWGEVLTRAGLGPACLASLRRLEAEVVRHKVIAGAGFSLTRYHADQDVGRFLGMQRDLFGAISEYAGARRLIDSSKAAPRAWMLAAMDDVKVVHLHRDPRAVATSWRSRKHDPSLGGPMRRVSAGAAFADWARAGASARALARQRPVLRLRYETLVQLPRLAMRETFGPAIAEGLAWSGPDMFTPDPDYHALNGNPDRFKRGAIQIRPSSSARMQEVAAS